MNLPIEIKNQRILIAGAGGGFDVFAGVPIGLQLEQSNNTVFYANYSFTNLDQIKNGSWISEGCLKITDQSALLQGEYFPEKFLSSWLIERGAKNFEVYCFRQLGVANLKQTYIHLINLLQIDAVFIVDGGCDGIFRGDEWDLGTPSMDSISVIAASLLDLTQKYYVLTAFGTEGANHEVSHAEALNRISDLSKNGGFIGSCSLVAKDSVAKEFKNCMEHVYMRIPKINQSIIVNSILSSVSGVFGYSAVTQKVSNSPIWVSPLTSIYWFFDLESVAKLKLFYNLVLQSKSVSEVADEIQKFRGYRKESRPNIPI